MKVKKSVGKRLHILEITLLLGIAVCLGSGAAALRVQSNLADKIVRLHVIANSDSPADQAERPCSGCYGYYKVAGVKSQIKK